MGTSSPAELAHKFRQVAHGFPEANRAGVAKAALLVTTSIRRHLAQATPRGTLSGVGKRGTRISVGFDRVVGGASAAATVRMRGPAHLIERNTRAHEITPKRGKRGRQALATPYGAFARVQHPGTKGKHPFERGVQEARPLVGRVFQLEVRSAMARVFR